MKLRIRNDLARLLVDPSDVSITFEPFRPYYVCEFTHYLNGERWGARLARHGETVRGWQFYWDNLRYFLDDPSQFDADHWGDRSRPGWYDAKTTPDYVATELVLNEYNQPMTQRDKDFWFAFDRIGS